MDTHLDDLRTEIRAYYGRVLRTKDDLKTGACCDADAMPEWLKGPLANLAPEITERFYGCGSPIPLALDGATVLDLGCGSGRDAYLLSQRVGARGRVIGIDMTEEQLEVARRHLDGHMRRFGYAQPNVEFHHCFIEDLAAAGIADNSVDVVVSNCVINLAMDKARVFREIFRVLKPGGELIFADIFAGRRMPETLRTDPVLVGECLGGAMYAEDFRRLLARIGCLDYRTTAARAVSIEDSGIAAKVGAIAFTSLTIRAFKCDFEDICENYGHVARYLGTVPEAPHVFDLDDHHRFETGLPVPVCGNTARMLSETRYAPHFSVEGDFSTHYGPFDCAPAPARAGDAAAAGACC